MKTDSAMQKLFDALEKSHRKRWGDIENMVDWYGIPKAQYGSEEYKEIKKKADCIRTINYHLEMIKNGE